MSTKLNLDDIADLREYEREREEFRSRVIDLKRRRRISVGPFVTFVFENRETIRFQIQEMARAERMIGDEDILGELEVYNPLIPDPGELSATMFIELTSKDELRQWLPKLVGIERAPRLRIGDGGTPMVVEGTPEEQHEEQLTREEATASVHYVRFQLAPEQIAAFGSGPVVLALEHENYAEETPLSPETVEELLRDLRGE